MIEQASAGYGSGESAVEILSKIKLNLVPGSRIGLLGKNGAGKSTLIKLLAGELTALSGTVQLAKGVQLGYFAQHQLDTLRADESALWHMQNSHRSKRSNRFGIISGVLRSMVIKLIKR